MGSAFDLERFFVAQADSYDQALRELRRGRKSSHWMWFVFPQVAGLGRTRMAKDYALSGLDEARAYLQHPVLGPRLVACAEAMTSLPGSDPVAVMGDVDALKLRSSMTLFALADPSEPAFGDVLTQYYDGVRDPLTLRLLEDPSGG